MGTTNIKQKKHLKKNYCHNHAVNLYQPFKILEKEFNLSLEPNSYYILRFDGKSMTKDYKIKNEPINDVFFKTMKETFKQFCLNKLSIIFAYSFSDEISILIRSSSSDEDECRIQKLISLYSSEISVLFFKNAKEFNLTLKRDSLF
ncbi:MAG: tRNA(His) guanylyltransferase Thg1 family protein, partial [Anaeroplasmataceae bacterium]|nr:tRNA(His) guanylyltransferase Thg1 family protein [Anaeroplasmataceae bacterium]